MTSKKLSQHEQDFAYAMALKLALEIDPIAQGKTNSDSRTSPVLLGEYLARNKDNCLELVEKLEDIDPKSWLLTAKLCSDEEHDITEEGWYKRGKEEFKDKDWAAEVDSFRLNNDGAKELLIEFAASLF